MFYCFDNVNVVGVSAAVPAQVEYNKDAEPYIGARRCRKQIKLTGIESRHVSVRGQKISDLGYEAANNLLNHLSWKASQIKVLILVTQHPNYLAPSTAFYLQKMLEIPEDCIVFDVNLGCSGFNVGIQIVSSLLQQFNGEAKGLCLQGDLASPAINSVQDADTIAGNLLFGSAVTATAIEKKESAGKIIGSTISNGKKYDAILHEIGGLTKMDGQTVFNFTINDVPTQINEFMQINHVTDDDVDFYVFHQAQKLILDNLVISLGSPAKKELRSLDEYGNTSGASVPLTICVNREAFNGKKNVRILSCGFGVGLSSSITYMTLNTANILPVVYTDSIYD